MLVHLLRRVYPRTHVHGGPQRGRLGHRNVVTEIHPGRYTTLRGHGGGVDGTGGPTHLPHRLVYLHLFTPVDGDVDGGREPCLPAPASLVAVLPSPARVATALRTHVYVHMPGMGHEVVVQHVGMDTPTVHAGHSSYP